MTDEQIEKALELCSSGDLYACNNCPLKTFIPKYDLSCYDFLIREAIDYIKRLKEECIKECKEHEAFVEIAKKEVEKAKKETAKECLKILHNIGGCGATDEWSKGYDSAIDTAYDEISEKYGISDFEDDEDDDFEFETATHEECVEHQKELQEMRKQTSKEILQELFDEAMRYGKTTDGIEWMAKEYGVEVEV